MLWEKVRQGCCVPGGKAPLVPKQILSSSTLPENTSFCRAWRLLCKVHSLPRNPSPLHRDRWHRSNTGSFLLTVRFTDSSGSEAHGFCMSSFSPQGCFGLKSKKTEREGRQPETAGKSQGPAGPRAAGSGDRREQPGEDPDHCRSMGA